LQGIWDFSSTTPLQRPEALGTKAEYTDEELANQAAQYVKQRERQESGEAAQHYSRAFTDDAQPANLRQTSILIDPPNGRLPPFTPAAQKWYDQVRAARKGVEDDYPTPGGWVEDMGPRGYFSRCIVGYNAGPPVVPQSYNQNVQIFQGPDHVALLHEMVHNTRVVWMDGRPHAGSAIRGYNGDSRGRWEGASSLR
jgi:hypothetical protein